jgi:ParB-like chromosome segregation protein Spo0J
MTKDTTKAKKSSQPERRRFEGAKLKPHPRQRELFDDLLAAELQALATSLRDNKLQYPIDVLPCGTILRGHKRTAAAKLLGWTTIDAVIRHDLVGQPDHVLVSFMIEDNLRRQHLGPLAIARCYRAEQAIYRAQGGRLSGSERDDMRDHLAKRFELSGRQMDRYAALLQLPRVLQAAVDPLPISVPG